MYYGIRVCNTILGNSVNLTGDSTRAASVETWGAGKLRDEEEWGSLGSCAGDTEQDGRTHSSCVHERDLWSLVSYEQICKIVNV